jgi:cytochrome c biogenesis protein CcmG/thiol:disulfide interchange protein DsbE
VTGGQRVATDVASGSSDAVQITTDASATAGGAQDAELVEAAGAREPAVSGGDAAANDDALETLTGHRRHRHTARWVAGVALVVVVAVVAVVATRPAYQATTAVSPVVGHQAPPITGVTLTGKPFSLASYRGRWVVLNFFASWCIPCQEEEPNLVAFDYQQQHRSDGAALVGVVFEDTAGAARDFQRAEGATWPTLADTNTQIALDYGVTSPPETFLITPTGLVADHIVGAVTEPYLDRQLARGERRFG